MYTTFTNFFTHTQYDAANYPYQISIAQRQELTMQDMQYLNRTYRHPQTQFLKIERFAASGNAELGEGIGGPQHRINRDRRLWEMHRRSVAHGGAPLHITIQALT